jgi:transcriptional regulator GlxA family with amidase domain
MTSSGLPGLKNFISLITPPLVRTEESIERIAETVGYGTGFALSKAFKRIAGVSPQHYRLQATR